MAGFAGFYRVPEDERWIIERFGKFDRIAEPGANFFMPWMEKIREKHLIKEQPLPLFTEPIELDFVDGATASPQGVIAFVQVIDPYKATYAVDNWKKSTTDLLESKMRAAFNKLTIAKALQLQKNILKAFTAATRRELAEALDDWGLQIHKITLRDLTPSPATLRAREDLFQQRRKRDMAALEREIRALETDGTLVDMLSEKWGLPPEDVQEILRKPRPPKWAQEGIKESLDTLHRRMAIDGKSFLDIRVDGAEGIDKSVLQTIALFKKLGGSVGVLPQSAGEKKEKFDPEEGRRFFEELAEKSKARKQRGGSY